LSESSASGQTKENCRELRCTSTCMRFLHRFESKTRSEALLAVSEAPTLV
jgi:hypothetical protein